MSAPRASPRNSLIRPNIASVRTRQVQLMSWAASAALHLPDGPAARRRDAAVARLADDLAWIHGYDALAPATGRGARCSAAAG